MFLIANRKVLGEREKKHILGEIYIFSCSKKRGGMIAMIIRHFCIKMLQNTLCGTNFKISVFYEKARYSFHPTMVSPQVFRGLKAGEPTSCGFPDGAAFELDLRVEIQ